MITRPESLTNWMTERRFSHRDSIDNPSSHQALRVHAFGATEAVRVSAVPRVPPSESMSKHTEILVEIGSE